MELEENKIQTYEWLKEHVVTFRSYFKPLRRKQRLRDYRYATRHSIKHTDLPLKKKYYNEIRHEPPH